MLATPTADRVSDAARKLLRRRGIEWIVLEERVAFDDAGAFAATDRKAKVVRRTATNRSGVAPSVESTPEATPPAESILGEPAHEESTPGESASGGVGESPVSYRPGPVRLDLAPRPDGFHWIVDGVDRGLAYHREESIQGRISRILFQQIGEGWIPHRTFVNATGWKRAEYFGPGNGGGRMQKHLYQIRRKTGVTVEFNTRLGVRFSDEVVNAGNQSKDESLPDRPAERRTPLKD